MSRFADALTQNTAASFAPGQSNAILDPKYGGMNGMSMDYAEWVSAQAYHQKNLIAFVIEYPKGFDYLPPADRAAWIQSYKAIIELHPQSITGLNSGLEVDVAENAVGGAGQMFEDFINVTEQRSQPQFEWIEKTGMVFGSFWSTFIRTFMMNPATKFADIMTLASQRPTDQLADLYSGTILFVEPDATMLSPVNAWLCTNFWPRSTSEITGKRDLTQAAETRNVSIQFASLTQQGLGVKTFARQILQSVNVTGANPTNRPAFVQAIDASLVAAPRGYKANVENLGAQAIQF